MEDNDKEETGIHMHCLSCNHNVCQEFPQCNVIYCPNACGVQFHNCKMNEHLGVCRKQIRPCTNAIHGCPFEVDSVSLMKHLECCPASVVQCGINWNRIPLYSKARSAWTPPKDQNPIMVEGHLDIEFAVADQKCLDKKMKQRMSKGALKKKTLQNGNKKISRISQERLNHLEALMNSRLKKSQKENMIFDRAHAYVIKGDEHPSQNMQEDGEFYTYDKLLPEILSTPITCVSNANIRDGYHDSPFAGSYRYEQPDIARRSNKFYMIDELPESMTKEEINERCSVHSSLKLLHYPLGLNVRVECLPSYFDQYPLYRFACNSLFRRDQFKWHVKNIHVDIAFNLNDWLMQRCPLSRYGCPYYQMRLKPKSQTVRFLAEFSCFSTQYEEDKQNGSANDSKNEKVLINGKRRAGLLDLPNEVLMYLFYYLDNLTLNNVAKSCHMLRNICHSLIDNLGIVVTTWRKKTYRDSGTSTWKAERKIRFFTTCLSPIREWVHNDIPAIGQHMQTCKFFHRRKLTKKVKLYVDGINKTHVQPKVFTNETQSTSESYGNDDRAAVPLEHVWML